VRPRGRVDDRRDVRTLTGDPDQTVRLTVVADDGDDDVSVEVEVEFDGETQTVDARTGDRTPGAFASLYDLGDGTRVTCEGVRAVRGTTESTCSALVLDLPYLPGHGWSGTGWTVVQLTTSTAAYRRSGSGYQVGEVTDASTIDIAALISGTGPESAAYTLLDRVALPAG
jgi:hypothetical protein